MEILQPHYDTILLTLAGLLTLGGILLVQPAYKWLKTRTTDAQRQLLHRIAAEAVAYVEAQAETEKGRQKLENARKYINGVLRRIGSKLTAEDIEAAIEKAVAEYKAQQALREVAKDANNQAQP